MIRCTPFAQRFASASNPVLATVVNHRLVPSASVAFAEVDRRDASVLDERRSRRAARRRRCRGGGRSRCPHPIGTMPSTPPVSAATPASNATVPSPPHATTPSPRANTSHAIAVQVARHRSRRAPRCRGPPKAVRSSGSSRRVRPRPAAGFTTAVQRTARDRSGGSIAERRRGSAAATIGSLHGVPIEGIDLTRVPRHVAIVMDGNGRWAQRRGLKRTDGHAAGEEALFDTVEGALEIGLRWMTVYAFSTENWRRPLDEVRFLMRFNESLLLRRRDDLNERGVRVRFIGRRGGRVPRRVLRHIEDTEALTARNRRMTLTFAFNYGGRAELADAVRAIAARGRGRTVSRRRRSTSGRSPGTSTRPTCPTPTSSCARRASTASRTSWCGSRPTPSSCSPTCCGPTSAAATSSTPSREFQRRERRFGAIDDDDVASTPRGAAERRRVRIYTECSEACTGTRGSCCARSSSGRPTGSSPSSTQGHGKVRAVAKGVRKPGSRFGARLEPTSHVAFQCYRGAASSTSSPRSRPSTPTGRCASTTAASPTRCRCSRPPTRSPRSASPTRRSTGCSSGALRTLAGRAARRS